MNWNRLDFIEVSVCFMSIKVWCIDLLSFPFLPVSELVRWMRRNQKPIPRPVENPLVGDGPGTTLWRDDRMMWRQWKGRKTGGCLPMGCDRGCSGQHRTPFLISEKENPLWMNASLLKPVTLTWGWEWAPACEIYKHTVSYSYWIVQTAF